MKESLENRALPDEVRNKMLTVICYNLADSLTNQGEYEEATRISEAGLWHGRTVGSHRMDGLLYYSLAKAQQLMGNIESAFENFHNSYYSHKAHRKIEKAEMVKKFALEKYGVQIEG